MNTDDSRFLNYYFIPKQWNVHLIDRYTNEKQLEQIQCFIENASIFSFDTETMPSFYQSSLAISKPALFQVAISGQNSNEKNVLLFDLQELFDRSNFRFHQCKTKHIIEHLIRLILNHTDSIKLSQSFFNDLSQLKCSYEEICFQMSTLNHVIELSDIYRVIFPDEKVQQLYSLQRMTTNTLHYRLNKTQQCANWSKRPLTQSLKDYAAIDVIVMIDIYDRLKTKFQQNQPTKWNAFQQSIEKSIDLNRIPIYPCVCGKRFVSNKSLNKHNVTCSEKLNARYFLQDNDSEVAQAFGFKIKNVSSKSSRQSNVKVAAYPPKIDSTYCSKDENELVNRLKEDIDSQPAFDRHLFGLGGRGRSLILTKLSPPSPSF